MSILAFGQGLAALMLVLGLIAVAAWLARIYLPQLQGGGPRQGGRLAVLEQRILDPKTRLVLVRCDGAEQLLVLGANGVTLLPAPAGEGPGEPR